MGLNAHRLFLFGGVVLKDHLWVAIAFPMVKRVEMTKCISPMPARKVFLPPLGSFLVLQRPPAHLASPHWLWFKAMSEQDGGLPSCGAIPGVTTVSPQFTWLVWAHLGHGGCPQGKTSSAGQGEVFSPGPCASPSGPQQTRPDLDTAENILPSNFTEGRI